MTDYKATLNLPKTAFPMKANLAQKEPQILKKWQSEDIYQKIRNKTKGAKTFILHDGPPYANGDIHLGHAVNKILKDIIIKSKTLSGYNAPYIPGWDCHGLPIEHNVEKKIGKAGDKVDPAIFRKECRKYAQKQVNGQRKDFIRLGVFGDWEKPYLTMDYAFEADIVRALGKIAKNGHLVKGYKPVYWSVVGRSALAEAEVEYHDKTSFAIDVKFACALPAELAAAFSIEVDIAEQSHMVIWTTTPWTLPANQAISLHAQLNYQLLQFVLGGEQLTIIVAEDLAASVLARVGVSEYEVLANCSGQQLEGVQFKHPFYARTVPVILGDHVTTEAGTGAVHTAPDHGVDDFNVGRKYGIGTLNIVADNGVYRDQVEFFAGEHVYKVDAHILEVLQQHQALLFQEKITHSYPHCWRTKTPLIFRATPQWFISMNSNSLLEKSLAAVKQTQWIPDWGQARIESMLNSSPDWCVSRQRTWGVPITLFIHNETEELHPNTEALTEQVAQLIADKGMDAWFDLDSTELLGEGASDYQKVTDTLDVWFDSGVTHQAVLEAREELSYPADLYLEGSDQHRGWFQSSLKSGLAITGRPPYKAVLTHGFTVDSHGKKMSKSLGNVISPQDVMKTLGADIIRLWIASTDYRGEMTVSDEILKRASDSYRRIRNTARFLLSNLNGFDPQSHILATQDLLPLDQWAMDKAWLLQQEIQEAYENYQFHAVYQKVHNFCAVDLGAFYLDIIKDRQYTTAEDSLARRSCQTAMYHIGQALVRWIAPILSFTAEELWQFMPGNNDESVFLLSWYDQLQPLLEQHELPRDFWLQLMEVKTAVNKALEAKRKNKEIGSSLSAEVTLYCSDELQTLLMGLGEELRFALITSAATIKPLGDEGEATELDGLRLHVEASKQTKCVRCWHYDDSVGQHSEHEELCARCVDNVAGQGEQRFYV